MKYKELFKIVLFFLVLCFFLRLSYKKNKNKETSKENEISMGIRLRAYYSLIIICTLFY